MDSSITSTKYAVVRRGPVLINQMPLAISIAVKGKASQMNLSGCLPRLRARNTTGRNAGSPVAPRSIIQPMFLKVLQTSTQANGKYMQANKALSCRFQESSAETIHEAPTNAATHRKMQKATGPLMMPAIPMATICLLYTSDAADE